MKGKLRLMILVVLVFAIFSIEAKSTMELLINKEWYEVDLSKMQIREDYYVKFTGTQRLTIGLDQDGNTKMRVQEYYLSDEETEIFDETKVGSRRKGKYLILKGKKHRGYIDAVCMELYQLNDMNLRMGDFKNDQSQQHCYVVEGELERLVTDEGTVISTKELLIDKMWYEVDIKSGKRKRTEVKFDKSGLALHCTIAENYKRELPNWQMLDYYFSDNIEYEFDHSKKGKRENGIYLVVKEKGENGEWFTANYDITTLSANRLVLDCVYPQGIPGRTFMTRFGLEKKSETTQKPQQWQLTENIWYRLDTMGWSRTQFTERFNKVNVTRRFPVVKNGVRDTIEISNPYYMSNTADSVFNFDKVGKTVEGDYVVINEHSTDGERIAVSYKIDYLDSKNMLLSVELDSIMGVVAYDRDLTEAELKHAEFERLDSLKPKTTLDYLSGRQWRFAQKPSPNISKWERWYFTDSIWAKVDFIYDDIKKVWNTKIKTQPYYLSDYAHYQFSTSQLDKKYEGGKYINFYQDTQRRIKIPKPAIPIYTGANGIVTYIPQRPMYNIVPDRRSFSYEICFLSENLFVFSPAEGVYINRFNMVND